MNRIQRKGDVILIRSGGPDEWKTIHGIRDAILGYSPQPAANSDAANSDAANPQDEGDA